MVNAQSPKARQDMTWKLIGYMLSHSEDYLTQVALPQPTKALLASDTFKNMPFANIFAGDLARAHIVYYGAHSTEMGNLVRAAVESVMLAGATPQSALATLRTSAQELINGN